jgi:hemolysin III
MGIYGISLVTLFTASAAYHLPTRVMVHSLNCKFDHSAIYVLIAGTYTPPILINFYFLRCISGLIWHCPGRVIKLFVIDVARRCLSGDGLMAVLIVKPMLQSMPSAALWWMWPAV